MPYSPGDRVTLAEFDNGDEVIPPVRVVILCYDPGSDTYVAVTESSGEGDDGLREFSADLIEGKLDEPPVAREKIDRVIEATPALRYARDREKKG